MGQADTIYSRIYNATHTIVAGQPSFAVIVPTVLVPVDVGLICVRRVWVTPADVGVDGVTSIYVSLWVTSNQHIGTRPPKNLDAQ